MATLITVPEVCAVIGIAEPPIGSADAVWMAQAVAAINALAVDTVPRLRLVVAAEAGMPATPSDRLVRQGGDVPSWPDDIRTGLLMQAQRLFRRRTSPTGIDGYTDAGGAVRVSRWDPDVERLLRIGAWAPPQVG